MPPEIFRRAFGENVNYAIAMTASEGTDLKASSVLIKGIGVSTISEILAKHDYCSWKRTVIVAVPV